MRIAIVGTGVAGLTAAWLLHRKHDVTVYEQDSRPGGHSHTVAVNYDGASVRADTGFMVYNERTYPNLVRMFNQLKIPTKPSVMSFSASIDDGRIEYAGTNLATLFAQKRNLARPQFWRMCADILRFNRRGLAFLESGGDNRITIEEFLLGINASEAMIRHYLLPMAGAIWSAPLDTIARYPAVSFLRFFANHGLLTVNDHPKWRTLEGGAKVYVDKIAARLGERLLLRHGVIDVRREAGRIVIVDAQGGKRIYDAAVMACHSDQTLAVMRDASTEEQRLLGAITFKPNRAVVHRDPNLMPKRRKVWSSWNYHSWSDRNAQDRISVTYWMNSLQGIDRRYPLFVSINPKRTPREGTVFKTIDYAHPVFDQTAIDAQREFGRIQGRGGIWYAGAWLGYGFHEDGMRSGLDAAQALGVRPPWSETATSAGQPPSLPEQAVASPDM